MNFAVENLPRPTVSAGKAALAGISATIALALGGGAVAEATTPPDTTPVTTPDTTPVTVTTPDTVAPDNGGSDIDWFPIILVVVLGIVLISLLVALMSRRKPAPASAQAARPASPQSEIMSTAQWVHDQLSLEILAAAPAAGLQRWTVERSRLDNIAIRANQQFTEGHGEAWQRLGQSISQLGAALDTMLQLRNQDPPNAQLIQESTDVVTRRRGELQMLLTAIWPSVQR